MKKYGAQVVVIAAGPAGLSAAVQAAEDGVDVIVLEKTSAVGGAANMGMGLLGIGTRYQKQQMIDITVEKAFDMFMEYTHYNVDARLIKRYFEMSADTIEWLEEKGVEFEGAFRYFPKSEATWHIVKTGKAIGPRAALLMNQALYERAKELGVTFLFETPAKKILMENGKVTGVLATDSAGEEVEIRCKAAVIATGGAGADKELIRQETGLEHGKNLFSFAIPGLVGDGLHMAWEAGADRLPIRIEMGASINLSSSAANVFSQPNLLVNKQGKRVMNEEQMQNVTYLSNVVTHQKDKVCFSILDSSIIEHYIKYGIDHVSLVRSNPDVSDCYDGIKRALNNENPVLHVGDSIEELAEKAGIHPQVLADTIEEYNDYCESVDEEFFKNKCYLRPLTKAPYYAAQVRVGGYGTVGGIRINENCEACDKDYEPIPGLYAAGADACNIYDDSYMFLLPGNSMGFAVNSGRIAGMSVIEYTIH
jgi:fumarate reductase flavoprotein subunit